MNTAEWIILGGIFFLLLTWWSIFDIVRKDFGGIEKKAAWAFLAMIPFIGPLVYVAVGMRKGRKQPKSEE